MPASLRLGGIFMADVQGTGGMRIDIPEIKNAPINVSATPDNTIITAVVGKRIAVLGIFLMSDGNVDARFEDGVAGTAFTGQQPFQARDGFVLPIGGPESYWWIGTVNTLLNLELSSAINVHGCVAYREIN